MTLTQIEAIYKANLPISELEAVEAVLAIGYLLGKGQTVTSNTNLAGIAENITAPTSIPVLSRPDLR